MPRTYIFVSRHYCAASNATTFTHRLFGEGGWQYTKTVKRGNVRTCKL